MPAIDNLLASISPLLDNLEGLIREDLYSASPGSLESPKAPIIWQNVTTKEVDSLQKQLQCLSVIVDKAQRAERSLTARYAAANNSLVPVAILPAEVLQHIFNMAVHTQDREASRPAGISAVCRHWRNVAVSYGALWTKICVDSEELHKVKTLATRTRGLPIELDIQHKPLENLSWMFDPEEMPHLGSLRMALTPDYSDFVPFRLLEDAEMNFSHLRLLDLRVDRSRFRGFGWETFRIGLEYINAPSLRSFKIEDFEITSMPDTQFRLTTLSIHRTAMMHKMFHQFLAGSPELEKMEISYMIFQGHADHVPDDVRPVTLPSLRHLDVVANFYEDFRDILMAVKAPRLERLWIQVAADGDSWDPCEYAHILRPFLSAISPRSLTHLTLFSLHHIIRKFIKLLSPWYPSGPNANEFFFPHLESLTFRVATVQHDMIWGEDDESFSEPGEPSNHTAEDEETRTRLQDLILLFSTRPQRLRKLHLSASLVGSTQFHDWLKRQVGSLTIDNPG